MAPRVPGDVDIRIYRLSRAGMTLTEIMITLDKEFDFVPDESTVYRHMKKFEQFPPEQLAEDRQFQWAMATKLPVGSSKDVLALWAYYMDYGLDEWYGPFTMRVAKWCWRLIDAFGVAGKIESLEAEELVQKELMKDLSRERPRISHPEAPPESIFPTPWDILVTANEYAWREIAEVVVREPFETKDLDFWIAFTPWRGAEWLRRYQRSRDRLGLFPVVTWHYRESDWLGAVYPEAAGLIEYLSQHQLPKLENTWEEIIQERSESSRERVRAVMRDVREQFVRFRQRLDGLLPSQTSSYGKVHGQMREKDQSNPPESPPYPWQIVHIWTLWNEFITPWLDREYIKRRLRDARTPNKTVKE